MSCACKCVAGNVAMFFDIIPTKQRPKLARVEAGTAEFDYMLATLVFDLVKKNALLHKALREHALCADPELTARLVRDFDRLDALEQDYAALAQATEELMLEAIAETVDDHLALARTVARWNQPRED